MRCWGTCTARAVLVIVLCMHAVFAAGADVSTDDPEELYHRAQAIRQQAAAQLSAVDERKAAQLLLRAAAVAWDGYPRITPLQPAAADDTSPVTTPLQAGGTQQPTAVEGFANIGIGCDCYMPALSALADMLQFGEGGLPRSGALAHALTSYAASHGDARAHAQLALRFALGLAPPPPSSRDGLGEFGEVDVPRALLHYYFAAAGNDTTAMLALAYRHAKGLGVPKSCTTAVMYYNPVAEQVVALAAVPGGLPPLERLRLKGYQGAQRSRQRDMLQYYQHSADMGNVNAQTAIGQLLNYGGHGLERDHAQALRYLSKAALAGDADAMVHMGHMYANGLGVAADSATALEWFNRAAQHKHPAAQYSLGYMHLAGYGVEKDYGKALSMFEQAASKGHTDAHFHLAVMHLNGWGVGKRDVRRAFHHFSHAAQVGHTLAMYNTAMMHASGIGTRMSCSHALTLLKKVALQGPWGAVLQRGANAFAAGAYNDALMHYLTAAEMGYEVAQTNAAWLLDNVVAVKPQRAMAHAQLLSVAMHARAAEQGNAEALLALGDAYYEAKGVPQNWPHAANYYRQASQYGDAQSFFNLAVMHQFGAGLPKDLHLAKRFFDLALDADAAAVLAVKLAVLNLRMQETWERIIAPRFAPKHGDVWPRFFTRGGFALLPSLLHRLKTMPQLASSPSAAGGSGGVPRTTSGLEQQGMQQQEQQQQAEEGGATGQGARALLFIGDKLVNALAQLQRQMFAALEQGDDAMDMMENIVIVILLVVLVFIYRRRNTLRTTQPPQPPQPAQAANTNSQAAGAGGDQAPARAAQASVHDHDGVSAAVQQPSNTANHIHDDGGGDVSGGCHDKGVAVAADAHDANAAASSSPRGGRDAAIDGTAEQTGT